MTVHELRQRIAEELGSFVYDVPPTATGRPLPAAAVQKSLHELRRSLVEPYRAEVERRDTFDEVSQMRGTTAEVWIVAHGASDTVVFFDPESDSFGLAQPSATGLTTIGV